VFYEFFLLDVQIGSEVETSRIVQGTAALQLYVQRCLMNLEKGVDPATIPIQQWEWMKNYRVWEANRKVFLYPENYIEPELRGTKTLFFEELEQELLQAEISQEAVEKAYTHYLDKFAAVANLKVVGSYYNSDPDGDNILYLFGRTRTEPYVYYYREYRNEIEWTPWKRLEITIAADFVTPVYAFNRLYLFWPEQTKFTRSEDVVAASQEIGQARHDKKIYPFHTSKKLDADLEFDGDANKYYKIRFGLREQQNVDLYRVAVKYTYINFSQEWIQPQTYSGIEAELTDDQRIQPQWQRVYAQRSLEFFGDQSPSTQPGPVNVSHVLHVNQDAAVTRIIPNYSMEDLTWEFLVNFQNAIPNGTINEFEPKTISLLTYTSIGTSSSSSLDVRVTNNIRRIPGAPDVDAAREARDAASQARDEAQDTLNAAQTAYNQNQSSENEAALANARANFDQAYDNLKVAETAYQEARVAPQWESPNFTLTWLLSSQPIQQLTMAYDQWQHIAMTLTYQNGQYNFSVYYKGQLQTPTPAPASAELLPTQGELSIGVHDLRINSQYAIQLSEFRLWDRPRNQNTILADMGERKSGQELGLFHLPLEASTEPSPALALTPASRPTVPVEDRERIIILYGNQIKSLRNTIDDQSFTLTLETRSETQALLGSGPDVRNYDADLSLDTLHVTTTSGLSINDYADDDESTLSRFPPQYIPIVRVIVRIFPNHPFRELLEKLDAQSDFERKNYLLKNLRRLDVSLIDVNNRPGWYILDTGDEQFLVRAEVDGLKTTQERLKFRYDTNATLAAPQPLSMYFDADSLLEVSGTPIPSPSFKFSFERLSTFAIHTLSLNLFSDGIDGLLSLASQQTEEIDFALYQPNDHLVISPPSTIDEVQNRIEYRIDFDGANALYYREIFFHVPFFIANQLNANQNFAEAQKWYHYVFNPTAQSLNDNTVLDPRDRYWQYLPFRELSVETLRQILTNDDALARYRRDPFDPHTIAQLRINAYQKAVVMKYIDNLLDWGDNLFSQDTRESINEATQLYVLAFNLLGPRPEARTIKDFREIGTYKDIKAQRTMNGGVPDFVVDFGDVTANTGDPVPHNNIATDFCIVENEYFIGFWDRVEDRLFKIRHSLNIEGIFRQLALFQPPLDVRALVQAIAGGRDLGSVLSDLNVPVPHYRYSFMLEKAQEITGRVIELGSALLDALEKQDAEGLAILQNRHERQILDLMTATKEKEKKVVEESLRALNISQESIQAKHERFDSLIRDGLNAREIVSGVFLSLRGGLKFIEGVAKTLGEIVKVAPDAEAGGSGFGGSPVATLKIGADQFAVGPKAVGEAAAATGDLFGIFAEAAAKGAEYERRAAEWKFERTIAGHELNEIAQQIAVAQLQLEIANREIEVHERTLRHNQEIADFYQSKFTNKELYRWMASRLSRHYFQAYKLAYEFAKSAEKALQFELPTTQSYISFGHWDSLRKGLLAGESLRLELDRMAKSHLDQDSRFQEIEKNISLAQTMPDILTELRSSGVVDFDLGETLFNRDFPGHYARLIKTIAITIQANSDLTDAVHSTLIQTGNRTLLEPNFDAVQYLMGVGGDQPNASVLRTNWRPNQQIAVSTTESDDGMFVLDFFFDDRYFPFEGTGAVSSWRLEMPKETNRFDFNAISDVIIHLRYTSKYDNGKFRDDVMSLL
jgi:hypothetical protein